jgi:hypothetical protein
MMVARAFESIIRDRVISKTVLLMAIFFLNFFNSFAQEPPPSPTSQPPSVIGNWYLTIQSTEITEAGNDFTGNYESAVNQMLFSRNATSQYKPNWNVTINKSDVFWHSNLKLWIRRTGDGTQVSGSTINNGANYLEVLNTPVNFFDGYKEVDEVPLQLKITGLSVIIPANSYYTLLTFTVTEN